MAAAALWVLYTLPRGSGSILVLLQVKVGSSWNHLDFFAAGFLGLVLEQPWYLWGSAINVSSAAH